MSRTVTISKVRCFVGDNSNGNLANAACQAGEVLNEYIVALMREGCDVEVKQISTNVALLSPRSIEFVITVVFSITETIENEE